VDVLPVLVDEEVDDDDLVLVEEELVWIDVLDVEFGVEVGNTVLGHVEIVVVTVFVIVLWDKTFINNKKTVNIFLLCIYKKFFLKSKLLARIHITHILW
jgi:hypothetical protein